MAEQLSGWVASYWVGGWVAVWLSCFPLAESLGRLVRIHLLVGKLARQERLKPLEAGGSALLAPSLRRKVEDQRLRGFLSWSWVKLKVSTILFGPGSQREKRLAWLLAIYPLHHSATRSPSYLATQPLNH